MGAGEPTAMRGQGEVESLGEGGGRDEQQSGDEDMATCGGITGKPAARGEEEHGYEGIADECSADVSSMCRPLAVLNGLLALG